MEIGLAKGLAVDMGFGDQVQDQRYRQQMFKQQQAMNEAKAKMFADSLEFQDGGNSFDSPIVKDHSKKVIQQIGEYIQQNPDWETNVTKRAQVNFLKDSLKNNEHVLRAKATNDNYKKLLEYAQSVKGKPTTDYDVEALQKEFAKYDNYLKTGNTEGLDGVLSPFVFEKPQDFVDLAKALPELGQEVRDFDIVPTKYGGYYTQPKKDQIDAIKNLALQRYGRQIQVQAKNLGLDTPEKVDAWLTNSISAGVKKDFKLGDPIKYWEFGLQQKMANAKSMEAAAKVKQGNPSYTPWHYLVDEKHNPAGTISVDDFYKVWGGNHPIRITGTDGNTVDLSEFAFKPTGRVINQGGKTFFPGYIDIPIEVAEDRGLYKSGVFTIDGPTAGFRDRVKEVDIMDKDGKPVKAVRVQYELPINRDDKVAMQKFNIMADVDKLVPPSVSPEEQSFYDQGGQQKMFNIGGYQVPVGAKVKDKKTGKVGILRADGTIR